MLKKIFFFILGILFTTNVFAFGKWPYSLTDSDGEGKGIGYKIGYEYQKSSYLEAGLLFHKWKGLGVPMGFRGILVGGECRLGGSKFYCGPKISFEAAALFLGGRATLTYLSDFKQGALIFAPEIGFSFEGSLYVYAGYNLNITNKDFLNMNGFKISLGFNLYALDYWKEHKF